MGGTGFEPPQESSGKTGFSETGGAESDALLARPAEMPADLQAIVVAWPSLSKDARREVLVAVQEAGDRGGPGLAQPLAVAAPGKVARDGGRPGKVADRPDRH